MPRMLVLTDSETAIGFRLAGVEVRETTSEEAQTDLEEIILSDKNRLVVVDEAFIDDPNPSSARDKLARKQPGLLPMPSLAATFGEEADATEYMKKLVRDAIGFDVRME